MFNKTLINSIGGWSLAVCWLLAWTVVGLDLMLRSLFLIRL